MPGTANSQKFDEVNFAYSTVLDYVFVAVWLP